LVGLVGCRGADRTQVPTKGDIYVYVASPLSGFMANGGQTVLGGVNLMAEQLNRSGGLLGYRVVVVPMDDEADSDVAVLVAEQVQADVQAGKPVVGLIGHYNSGQTLAAMEVYKDLPIVVITPTSSELSITQKGYRNFFRVNANDAVQASVDARFLVEQLGAQRIAVVHNDTEYGIGLRDLMSQALTDIGAQVAVEIQVGEGQERYDQEVQQILQASADAVFYAGYEIEAPYLRLTAVEAGLNVPFLASDGAFLSATIDESEGTAEGMYISGFAPSPEQAVDEAWIAMYQQVEFRNPDTYSINGYTALQVLADGVKEANSIDATRVSDAIRSMSFDTPMGALSYEPNGDLRNATVYIFQVQDNASGQVHLLICPGRERGVFTGLRSRLMLSFSLLLVACLVLVALALVFFFGAWVSLPQLAYARLMDAAVPVANYVRNWRQQGGRSLEAVSELQDLVRERGIRLLVVNVPGGVIVADTERDWIGSQIQIEPPTKPLPTVASYIRGRARSPDNKVLFYVAVPLSRGRDETNGLRYLVLGMNARETVRPFVGSLTASVFLSGVFAFALSIPLAFWFARTLSRPLQAAVVAAERVAGGDYAVTLDIAVPDEARRLAESFNTMTRAVETSQRSQQDFVANVSHELRTPLTSIQGFAQAILDGTAGDSAAVKRSAQIIHTEAERLGRMVGQLLELARLESGESAISQDKVDLAALVRACVDQFAALADEAGVLLVNEMPRLIQVTGDGDRLRQVFSNLIDNAIKYNDPGGKVVVSAEEEGTWVSVKVADTGHGIPEADLSRVFERFYQVDKSRSKGVVSDRRGTGLGLSIAAQIVRAHGGTIDVQSIVGVGTQFVVTLPQAISRAGSPADRR
jgi:signal transduction histidine kinase/ABC-type branched-subunit amino acid transport system substrate-binding protein